MPNQNSVTYVNWASDAAQLWDRAVYEMDEGKVITCVMAMLRQFAGRMTKFSDGRGMFSAQVECPDEIAKAEAGQRRET